MNKVLCFVIACISLLLIINPVFANEKKVAARPWEKWSFTAGGMVHATNTAFRLGGGAGTYIDVEEFLDLDATNTVYFLGGHWRFTENRRHRIDLSWFSLNRSGEKTIGQAISLPREEDEGETDTIPEGTKVESHFEIDVYKLNYSYSFYQDDRVDLAANLGLYIMPLSFGLKTTGVVDVEGDANFTAPLPTIGFRMDFALAPKWFFRSGTQVFYLEYQDFKGGILYTQGAIEYSLWKHFGLGFGVDAFRIEASADGEDYPEIDFSGNVEFNYVGLKLYGRLFF